MGNMDRALLINKLNAWQKHLDVVVGVLAFNLALGCVSISNGWISIVACGLSIYICLRVMDLGYDYFPGDVTRLRQNNKKTRREVIELSLAEKKLGKLKTPLLYTGFLSLYGVGVIKFFEIYCPVFLKILKI